MKHIFKKINLKKIHKAYCMRDTADIINDVLFDLNELNAVGMIRHPYRGRNEIYDALATAQHALLVVLILFQEFDSNPECTREANNITDEEIDDFIELFEK